MNKSEPGNSSSATSGNADAAASTSASGGSTSGSRKSDARSRRKAAPLAADGAREPQVEGLLEAGRDLGARVETFVRERPIVSIAGATVLGALLGGVVFSRAGRLVFIAAAGALATEVWKTEGKIDIRGLLDKLTREDDATSHDADARVGAPEAR
jgi:ElaB/YqjD/DUF883 family membrane-anchored ribosome-binding protein